MRTINTLGDERSWRGSEEELNNYERWITHEGNTNIPKGDAIRGQNNALESSGSFLKPQTLVIVIGCAHYFSHYPLLHMRSFNSLFSKYFL